MHVKQLKEWKRKEIRGGRKIKVMWHLEKRQEKKSANRIDI